VSASPLTISLPSSPPLFEKVLRTVLLVEVHQAYVSGENKREPLFMIFFFDCGLQMEDGVDFRDKTSEHAGKCRNFVGGALEP
jgi:hypothetical protein